MRLAGCLVILTLASTPAQAIVSVKVVDGSVVLPEVSPTVGAERIVHSTTDYIRFSNDGATEPQLIVYEPTTSFRYDRDGVSTRWNVAYQSALVLPNRLVFASQSSTGTFLPHTINASADLSTESPWTPHAECGTVTYRGSWSIVWYSNAAVRQSPYLRYFMVCDTPPEVYVDTDTIFTDSDAAFVVTRQGILVSEAEYIVRIGDADYAFVSAGSATTVTLSQARFTPIPLTEVDSYFLYAFPDGFPAGAFTTTFTAKAYDITIG